MVAISEAPIEYWAVVPAAGVGKRMGADIPKQYLDISGRPVIAHTIERLLAHPRIRGVVVVLSAHDCWWQDVDLPSEPFQALGGEERCHSVLSGLRKLLELASPDARVMVHDAVRPCLRAQDIDKLIESVGDYSGGGLLGLPVRDTMKRARPSGEVEGTVPREDLWHALTPQLFPLKALMDALARTIEIERLVTDEAQAMELAGAAPRMVEGHPDNIKITRRQDLKLAELYLDSQGAEA